MILTPENEEVSWPVLVLSVTSFHAVQSSSIAWDQSEGENKQEVTLWLQYSAGLGTELNN